LFTFAWICLLFQRLKHARLRDAFKRVEVKVKIIKQIRFIQQLN
jgi:hypothetical protein